MVKKKNKIILRGHSVINAHYYNITYRRRPVTRFDRRETVEQYRVLHFKRKPFSHVRVARL